MRTAALQKCSVYSGSLILVNARHPYRGVPDPALLMPVNGESGVLMDRRAAVLLERLMAEIRGWNGIVPVSGWRPREEQQAIWDDTLRESGEAFTKNMWRFPAAVNTKPASPSTLGFGRSKLILFGPIFPTSASAGYSAAVPRRMDCSALSGRQGACHGDCLRALALSLCGCAARGDYGQAGAHAGGIPRLSEGIPLRHAAACA